MTFLMVNERDSSSTFLINKRPHFLAIYKSINSKLQHSPNIPPPLGNPGPR